MSPIIINSTTSNVKMPKAAKKVVPEIEASVESLQGDQKEGELTEKAREDRKATGRSVAILILICLVVLALYQTIKKKTILAGVSWRFPILNSL